MWRDKIHSRTTVYTSTFPPSGPGKKILKFTQISIQKERLLLSKKFPFFKCLVKLRERERERERERSQSLSTHSTNFLSYTSLILVPQSCPTIPNTRVPGYHMRQHQYPRYFSSFETSSRHIVAARNPIGKQAPSLFVGGGAVQVYEL